MTIVVLGGTGFVGRRVVERLVSSGRPVTVVSRGRSDRHNLEGVTYRYANIGLATSDLDPICEGASAIVNCAGELAAEQEMAPTNVAAVGRILELAKRRGIRIIQLSSIGVYGHDLPSLIQENQPHNPTNQYEATKSRSDLMVLDAIDAGDITGTVLRPSNIYGPNMSSSYLHSLFRAISTGRFCYFGGQASALDLLHVDDLADAIVRAVDNTQASGPYNLANGIALKETVARVQNLSGQKRWIPTLPFWLGKAASQTFGDRGLIPLTSQAFNALTFVSKYDTSRALLDLDLDTTVSSGDGLTQMIETCL